MKTVITILVLLIVGALIMIFVPRKMQPQAEITDFETCSKALGSVIQESYPPVCKTSDGRAFTQKIVAGDVVVETPKPGDLVTSPLTVKAKARGQWFFEANIPVTLKDQTGKTLAQKGFQAKGEWMTADYVEFEGTLEFSTPTAEFGLLIIEKDNPSGLPEHDDSFVVPVRFR